MGYDILYRVGNGGRCGCETVSREVLPQVEIPEKWTQEPPNFAITTGVRLRSHTNHAPFGIALWVSNVGNAAIGQASNRTGLSVIVLYATLTVLRSGHVIHCADSLQLHVQFICAFP